jgi:autotransporter-associated beta strand protein
MIQMSLLRNNLIWVFLLMGNIMWGQTIFSENFDSGSSPFGFATITSGTTYTGSSAAADGPSSSPFFVSSTTAYGVSNATATLTSGNINTTGYTGVSLTFRAAAFSIGNATNGMDAADNIKVEVSPNGGTSYFSTVQVNGNSNAFWSYSGGSGLASTAYDGDATAVTFAPTGGGNRTSDGYSTITVTSMPIASNVRIRITMLTNSTAERWVIDDISISGTALVPSIAISSAHPASGNFNSNSTNNIVAGFQFDVTTAAATFTGISVTTAGTYSTSDIQTNGFKFWINSSNSLSGATQLGASQAAVGSGGTVAVSGLTQSIPIGTRYILLTADISSGATGGNTININSTPFSAITFSSGTKTGTDPVGASNTQTILALTPSIAISPAHPAAGNVNFNSTDNIIGSIQFDVTTVAASLTGISVTTAGTYSAGDIQTNGFKFWVNSTNSLSGATQLGTSQAAVGTGGTVAVSGLSTNLPIGTRYILVTASISVGATGGNTIGIASTPFSSITFVTGTKTGTDPVDASNLQTITVPSIAIAAAHPAAGSITAGTTNNLIASIQLDVTTLAATLSAITVTTTGTYTAGDVATNGFKFWINSTNSTSGATQLGASQAAVGSGGTVAVSGLSTSVPIGTRYLLVTVDLAATAINGRTIGITTTAFSDIVFTNGTKTGTDPVDASNLQTIFSNAGSTTIAAGAASEPASISSLINTQGAAVLNFDIDIVDDGSSPSTDALPTLISQIVFAAGTGNDVANWTLAIAGAELSDGTNTMTGTVASTTITFASINTADLGLIADDATKNYTLKVWLNTDMSSLKTTIDGLNLVFRIQNANVTTDPSGSKMAAGQDQNSGATNNAIDVQPSALAFVQNTSNANVGAAMSPAVTVSVNDANGNRDLGYLTAVSITSTGTLTGSPVNATPSSGLATFSTLTHTVAGAGFQLTAASGALSTVLSNTFTINDVSLAADFFRSNIASGSWGTAGNWQSSHDNSTWITATLSPTSASAGITIQSGNVITISSTVTIDQVVVANGGSLTFSIATTINDGTGDDIVVQNGGTVIYTVLPTYGAATIRVNSGGILSVQSTGMTGNAAGVNASTHVYDDGSILEYNVASSFSASGVTYFPNAAAATVPTYRVTTVGSGTPGGGSALVVNGILEANGSFSFTGAGTKTFRNGISGTGALTQGSAGQFIISGTSAVLTGAGTLTLGAAGLLVNSGANITGDKLIAGAGALTKQGSGTLFLSNASNTFSLGTTITAGTVSVDGPNRLGSSAGSLTIATATFQSTAAAGISSARNIVLTGSPSTIDITTSSYIATSAAVVSGSGPLTKTGAGLLELQGTNTYTGLTTVSGGTFRLNKTGGTTIPATNSISVDNAATLRISSNQTLNTLTLASGSTLLVDDGVTLTITGTLNQNGGTITVGTGAIAYGASGTLSYGGSSAQNATTAEFPSASGPRNLTINNSNGVSLNNLSFSPVLNGTLTFTSGKLVLGANNLVLGSSATISGANSSKYVITDAVGALTRNSIGNTATLFPVGDVTYYTPVTLTNGGTTDNFTVNFTSAAAPSCLTAETAVTATWDISEAVAGGSNCAISIDYGSVPAGGSFVGTSAKIGHCTGGTLDYVNGTAAGTVVSGSGFTNFSPFGVTTQLVLPIELTSFNANLRNRKTYLNWSTATEQNNAFFSIERSTDGVEFRSIGKVNGAGNSSAALQYGFIDEKPVAGINFYRLKQVDFDGKFEYSDVVSVTVGKTGNISLSPVPAQDQLHVNLETALVNDGTWQLLDYTGRLLQSGTIPAETFDFNVDVTTLTPGAYFLRMVDGQTVVTKQFQK